MPSLAYRMLAGLVLALAPELAGAQDDVATIDVTSRFSSGPGSIREAIDKANDADARVRIVSRLEPGTVIYVFRELPPLVGYGVEMDGGGMRISGESCVGRDGERGCDGLVVDGPDIAVRNLAVHGFLQAGIAIRGQSTNVRVEHCEAVGNRGAGIAVSSGAKQVSVGDCTIEKNGPAAEGKGVIILDYAEVHLRDCRIRYNRDGVMVGTSARATLRTTIIEGNYDNGLTVAGGEVTGRENTIVRNGRDAADGEAGHHADGVRATLDSTIILEDTTIAENGDGGVVVLGSSTVSLTGGRIADNGGVGVDARDRAVVELRKIDLTSNGGGEIAKAGKARVLQPRATR